MRYLLLITIVILLASVAIADTVKVAVIDSGYNGPTTHLCETGHYDLVAQRPVVGRDQYGHGGVVAKAIIEHAGDADYCLIILKVFGRKGTFSGSDTIAVAVRAAVDLGAKVLNLSLSGPSATTVERKAIEYAVNHKVVVFVSAGNDGINLDKDCKAYPACYKIPGVFVVGSDSDFGRPNGNQGSIIDEREDWCYGGICGTSLSTGIATGKFVAGYK